MRLRARRLRRRRREGGQTTRARGLLDQTFGSGAEAIDNGRLNLTFQLDPKGLLALGGPIKLALDGPFAVPGKGQLPHVDVDFAGDARPRVFRGTVLSTGRAAFVRLDERSYKVDREFVARLRKGLRRRDSKQPGLKALGIDPLRWMRGARSAARRASPASTRPASAATSKVATLLADIDRAAHAGRRSGGGRGGLLSPEIRKQIADGVKTAKVDIWTGTEDKIMRQLAVRIDFAFKANGETADRRPRGRQDQPAPAPDRRQRDEAQRAGAERRAAAVKS